MINRRALFAGLFAAAVATPAVAQERTVRWGNKTLRYDPVKQAAKMRFNSYYGKLRSHKYYISWKDGRVDEVDPEFGRDLTFIHGMRYTYSKYATVIHD